MTKETITKRLIIIKQLLKIGLNQSKLSDNLSFLSILSIHDSIDMFMNLSAEKKAIKSRGLFLMQYFDHIPELILKSSVEKINKRRNSLKHDGLIPGRIEIEETCSIAIIFFKENTPKVFDIDSDSITLFSLIDYDDIRIPLETAQAFLENGDHKNAIKSISIAFYHTTIQDRKLQKGEIENPLNKANINPIIKDWKFYTQQMEPLFEDQELVFTEHKTEEGYVEISEGLASIAYRTNNALNYIFDSLDLLRAGVGYRQYRYFESFMPKTYPNRKKPEQLDVLVKMSNKNRQFTKAEVEFAIQFVLDFTLKLQEIRLA